MIHLPARKYLQSRFGRIFMTFTTEVPSTADAERSTTIGTEPPANGDTIVGGVGCGASVSCVEREASELVDADGTVADAGADASVGRDARLSALPVHRVSTVTRPKRSG